MRILHFLGPLLLTVLLTSPFVLQALAPTKGVSVVDRKDVKVIYSVDVPLATDGEMLICLFSTKLKTLLCMTPDEYLVRADVAKSGG